MMNIMNRKRSGSGSSLRVQPRYETVDARDVYTETTTLVRTETTAKSDTVPRSLITEAKSLTISGPRPQSRKRSHSDNTAPRSLSTPTLPETPEPKSDEDEEDEDDLETELFSFKARKLDEAFQSGDYKWVRQRSSQLLNEPSVKASPDRQTFLLNILSSALLEEKLFSEAQERLEQAKRIALSKGDKHNALGFELSKIYAKLMSGESDKSHLEEECKKLIKDMRRLCGKEHHNYYSSLLLMSTILRRFGENDDAEAYESLLPASYANHSAFPYSTPEDISTAAESSSSTRFSSIVAPPIRSSASTLVEKQKPFVNNILAQHHLRLSPSGKGIDGHAWDKNVALISCARSNDAELMDALYHSGELTIDVQLSAMHVASMEGNVAAMKKLLEFKENINSKNNYGNTPLMLAAFRGSVEAVDFLVTNGADMDSKMPDGCTALAVALWSSSDAAAVYLIHAGASYNNLLGGKALHLAARFGNWKSLDWLITRGKKTGLTNLGKPGKAGKLGIEEEEEGMRPLHLASMNGHVQCVRVLLAAGANVDAKTKSGETSRDLALKGSHQEVIELLKGKRMFKYSTA